ncbi:hypothetical protein MTO96_010599 [Rhipicephalus appendiculatus]
MRREQAKDKRRIIIASVVTLGSVFCILLALLVWLLSPRPHLKPTTNATKASKRAATVTSGPQAYHRNDSRFGVGEQDEEASDDSSEHWDLRVWLRRHAELLPGAVWVATKGCASVTIITYEGKCLRYSSLALSEANADGSNG